MAPQLPHPSGGASTVARLLLEAVAVRATRCAGPITSIEAIRPIEAITAPIIVTIDAWCPIGAIAIEARRAILEVTTRRRWPAPVERWSIAIVRRPT